MIKPTVLVELKELMSEIGFELHHDERADMPEVFNAHTDSCDDDDSFQLNFRFESVAEVKQFAKGYITALEAMC